SAVAIQLGNNTQQNPDKIVIAGFGGNNFALVRYNLDGTLDTSFNGTGIVTNAVGPAASRGFALLVQGSGTQPRKITVAGYSQSGADHYFAVARYNGSGSFDTTFGTNGTLLLSFGAGHDD